MQVMLAAFLQMNTKNTGTQSVQADQIGRTYPPLFTLNLPKEDEIIDDLREITAMEYIVQVIMFIVFIAVVIIVMYFCCTKCRHTHTIFRLSILQNWFGFSGLSEALPLGLVVEVDMDSSEDKAHTKVFASALGALS